MLLGVVALAFHLAGLAHAECGKSIFSDDGKIQYLDGCSDSSYPANITVQPGVTRLDISNITAVQNLDCRDNTELSSISASELQTVYGNITFSNVSSLSYIDLPKLYTAGNVVLENVKSINIPELYTVTSMRIVNTNVQYLTSVLKDIESGTVEISSNDELQQLNFPNLESVTGGLLLKTNAVLQDLSSSFPSLATINGDVEIAGNITGLTLPALAQVRGTLNVNGSTALQTDCDSLDTTMSDGAQLAGDYECVASDAWVSASTTTNGGSIGTNSTASGTASSTDSSLGSSSGLSFGASVGILFGVLAIGIAGLILALILLRRKKQQRKKQEQEANKSLQDEEPILDTPDPWAKAEMPGDSAWTELPADGPAARELHGEDSYKGDSKSPVYEMEGSIYEMNGSVYEIPGIFEMPAEEPARGPI
ncbi:cell wall protein Ecm33 [Pestalotiopsis sp. IQ-011]